MRGALTAIFRRLLRIFFRRIEVTGVENVPLDRPIVFAVNHPNGLVDPLFILCFAPRRVSFLAKAPLLTMPVIGSFVRAFQSVPVYRKQDGTSGSTAETFRRAGEILRSGGTIAIFPEGTTHSDPWLREFKTGAARIALGARSGDGQAGDSTAAPSVIVPVGIYYTEKQTFRSRALVYFGKAIPVSPTPLGPEGEPPPAAVHELTARTEEALAGLTLQADSRSALELIASAEDIFFGQETQPLAAELELRRRFVTGYHYLRERDPARLESLQSRIRRFESELGTKRIEPHELTPRIEAMALIRALLLFPPALIGAAVHYPVYRLVRMLSRRFSRGADEMMATVKFVSALLLYPLMWIAAAFVAGILRGPVAAVVVLLVLPLLGFVAVRVAEEMDDALGQMRALVHRFVAADAHARLVEERRAIRREIIAVSDEMEAAIASVVSQK